MNSGAIGRNKGELTVSTASHWTIDLYSRPTHCPKVEVVHKSWSTALPCPTRILPKIQAAIDFELAPACPARNSDSRPHPAGIGRQRQPRAGTTVVRIDSRTCTL